MQEHPFNYGYHYARFGKYTLESLEMKVIQFQQDLFDTDSGPRKTAAILSVILKTVSRRKPNFKLL